MHHGTEAAHPQPLSDCFPWQVLIRSMVATCSSAMIGYGLEAFVDMVASILVRVALSSQAAQMQLSRHHFSRMTQNSWMELG
jgi:hypothetical protein